jgi:integrase/recombinase XerD
MEQRPRQQRQLDHHHQQIVNDPNFDRKFDQITAGARPYIRDHLLTRITRANCMVIIDYILALQTEVSPSDSYRIDTIFKLKQLAEFHNPKPFKDMTRQDIIDYLDRLRKPESVDPMHKWIGTYEHSRILLLRFFRWLHNPNADLSPRKRPKPDVMQNIPKITRRETSTYKPTDLWTEEDDVLFYKYCPSPRDRCWHAVSRDTGCRPHELLKLKIKDVVVQQLDNGYQIARITVNGKTGTRNVRLNNSYPRLKDWLSNGGHPYPGNPNAPLFCGIGKRNTGKRLASHTIQTAYMIYKNERFPKLLEDPTVPEEDKRKVKDLLQKPWNPYIRRHTAATEISKILKDSVLIDQYMGWSHAGNTRQKYQHYYADDSFDAMLTMMDGLTPASGYLNSKKKNLLKPKQCPNCDESNKPENKFCSKCRFVLSFDAFNETMEQKSKELQEAENAKKELAALKARQEEDSRKQQMDIEQMKTQLRNTGDQVGMLLQMLSNIQKQEVNAGTATTQAPKDFVLQKLGVLTNGKIGEDPETGLIIVPPSPGEESHSKRCCICERIEREENKKKETDRNES